MRRSRRRGTGQPGIPGTESLMLILLATLASFAGDFPCDGATVRKPRSCWPANSATSLALCLGHGRFLLHPVVRRRCADGTRMFVCRERIQPARRATAGSLSNLLFHLGTVAASMGDLADATTAFEECFCAQRGSSAMKCTCPFISASPLLSRPRAAKYAVPMRN